MQYLCWLFLSLSLSHFSLHSSYIFQQDSVEVVVEIVEVKKDTIPCHLRIAKGFIGYKEVGNNRGYWVDRFNRHVKVPLGSPYCAAFVSFVLDSAGVTKPSVRSGLARNFKNNTKEPYRYSALSVIKKQKSVRQGDIVGWERENSISGHLGIALENWSGQSGKTIEANTSSGVAGSQSDGDGIYTRVRKIEPFGKFRITWFVIVDSEPCSE